MQLPITSSIAENEVLLSKSQNVTKKSHIPLFPLAPSIVYQVSTVEKYMYTYRYVLLRKGH